MIAVTILANGIVIAALYLGWHLNAFSALQLVSAGVLLAALEVIIIFPFRLWKSDKAEITRLNERITSSLKCSFTSSDPGCIRPNTIVTKSDGRKIPFTWYRIRVEAIGPASIGRCSGRLVSVRRGDTEMLAGETPTLPFAPSEEVDSIYKIINPLVPEFLDFLAANQTNGIVLPFKGFLSQAVNWNELFRYPSDYFLKIVVVSENTPRSSIELKFSWTLDPTTSTIVALS
jgi:hypothetical protein